ncbi:MAG: ribonuclease HII [Firmicutes bacterium]|nr:ribonuclease HII [Bacillota bacterium]
MSLASKKKTTGSNEEIKRQMMMYKLENRLLSKGYKCIAGVDEAGRGPLAGPVLAAAAIIPPGIFIDGLNDSKKLSAKRRELIYEQMLALKIPYGLGEASVEEIDRYNILKASQLAMMRAVESLPVKPDYLLIDGYAWPGISLAHQGVVGGDTLSLSIAAASILAKVTRDRIMQELDRVYPGYGFAKHKGYPTAEHFAAIARLGPSVVHRRSFNLRYPPVLPGREELERQ